MASMVKHLALIGISLPVAIAGYHAAMAESADRVRSELASRRLVDAVHGLTLGTTHELGQVELLERSLYYVEQRYVEKDRLDTEAMFAGALDLWSAASTR